MKHSDGHPGVRDLEGANSLCHHLRPDTEPIRRGIKGCERMFSEVHRVQAIFGIQIDDISQLKGSLWLIPLCYCDLARRRGRGIEERPTSIMAAFVQKDARPSQRSSSRTLPRAIAQNSVPPEQHPSLSIFPRCQPSWTRFKSLTNDICRRSSLNLIEGLPLKMKGVAFHLNRGVVESFGCLSGPTFLSSKSIPTVADGRLRARMHINARTLSPPFTVKINFTQIRDGKSVLPTNFHFVEVHEHHQLPLRVHLLVKNSEAA
ncbi:hypothetical protein TcWFU_001984 [Taenia crassiceps]|uniref:Uncharacterized protein n=1 Tax=Taenia crassiceps TaxID=6207 RepID=A0ABR4QCV9_9CEST